MMSTLELVRAGAGSGKTTDLCETVAAAVAGGMDPARILATTFTRKAAAELKGRIQARLLDGTDGDATAAHRQADRLELAAIGTVHGVAHQLLARYAIQLGLSPRLEILTEVAGARALRDLLGSMPVDSWQHIRHVADRLAVTDLQQRILKLLAAKRGNRISDENFLAHMRTSADRVCALLAPQGSAHAPSPADRFFAFADQALANIETLTNDVTAVTNKARQGLRRLCSQRSPAWTTYLQAARLSAGKKSGADALLDPLRNHAAQVRQNPQLHADVREFSLRLASETNRLDALYHGYKVERGLLDFTDLEVLFLELLENDALSPSVAQDFDLILVDEFQDTNPLQLAIFQRLRQLAPRSRWVGDPKQAIYGFRDTDPDLINDVWRNAVGALATSLPNNHRSQRGLVQIVGTLFAPIFGAEATQCPQKPAMTRGVERWLLNTKNQPDDAAALACGIFRLHAEGIRFGDMAVLERKNDALGTLAAALDELGIPYLLGSPGLLATREGVLTLAGVRLVADRNDSLAAATILHMLGDPTLATPAWLSERLDALRTQQQAREGAGASTPAFAQPWDGDVRFLAIENIDRQTLSPLLVVQQVIEALNLPTLVRKWGDPARRCANLDSLLQHTQEYEDAALETGEAVTIPGLILYLERLAEDDDDVRHPPLGHDAVTLTTYHSAKGLEWPVVILGGLNSDRDPDMWSPVVTGGNPGGDDPLTGRMLRAWVWPFGYSDGPFPRLATGSDLETDALASGEGEDRTRRAQQENLRLLYVGCTRAKNKLVFVHRPEKYEWLMQVPGVDALLDCAVGEGEHALQGIDTTFVLRQLNADMVADCRFPAPNRERWLAAPEATAAPSLQPRFHHPSAALSAGPTAPFLVRELSGPSHFPAGAKQEHYAAIGDAVHAYLASLPSMRALSDAQKCAVAERCLSAFSVTGLLSPMTLVSTGNRFCEWVDSQYPGARWITEVPVTSLRAEGGQWKGTIDLVLELPDDGIVIIDHKSAPIRREHCGAKAATFAAQLDGYREMMTVAGHRDIATWIHFPLAGVVATRE